MTNSEKFKEVFGFIPSDEVQKEACIIPAKVCYEYDECVDCPFNYWWSKEYKECFELREEYEQ